MDSMHRSWGTIALLSAAIALAGCSSSAPQSSITTQVPQPLPATPVGVTLVNLSKVVGVSPPDYLWTRLGDATGMKTLFVYAADTATESKCQGECAKDFPPVLASPGAVGFGAWSLVKRSDGSQQWAYQGKPLYTFAKEKRLNQVVDTLLARQDKEISPGPRRRAPLKDALLPPEGWSVARFEPEKDLTLPASIAVKTLAVQDGMGDALVTAAGMTLYGFNGSLSDALKASCAKPTEGDRSCGAKFEPYRAPEAASAVGDFSIVKLGAQEEAGQWAYKGVPLYIFSGDHKPTDAYGVYGDYGPWQVMFLYLDAFPENVQAIESVGHDRILADLQGHPLYSRAHFRQLFGGESAYHDYMAPYYMGAAIGTGGCDAECLKVRRPLPAPANAQSTGDWTVLTRPDGSKQWAFQGAALYTYTADTKPGIVNGHNITDYIVGDDGPYKISDAVNGEPGGGGMGIGSIAVGLYWYVTHPDWLGR
jgi:predicted lipoprotein with Yx(FWY)xxD motif